jgi:hypothetical protein
MRVQIDVEVRSVSGKAGRPCGIESCDRPATLSLRVMDRVKRSAKVFYSCDGCKSTVILRTFQRPE